MPKPKTISVDHAIFCGVFEGKSCDMDCQKQEIINAKYGEIIDHD